MTYFWRAKCTITGAERKFRTSNLRIENFEQMQEWVGQYYRNLELLEYAEWDDATHGGVLYPVPVQHVKFDAPKPEIAKPDPKRISLLISASQRILRKKLLAS